MDQDTKILDGERNIHFLVKIYEENIYQCWVNQLHWHFNTLIKSFADL